MADEIMTLDEIVRESFAVEAALNDLEYAWHAADKAARKRGGK